MGFLSRTPHIHLLIFTSFGKIRLLWKKNACQRFQCEQAPMVLISKFNHVFIYFPSPILMIKKKTALCLHLPHHPKLGACSCSHLWRMLIDGASSPLLFALETYLQESSWLPSWIWAVHWYWNRRIDLNEHTKMYIEKQK